MAPTHKNEKHFKIFLFLNISPKRTVEYYARKGRASSDPTHSMTHQLMG